MRPHLSNDGNRGMAAGAALAVLFCAGVAFSQAAPPANPPPATAPAVVGDADEGKNIGGYIVRQSAEFGGRIVDNSGSQSVWNTFVDLQSGPRLMNYDLQMNSPNHDGLLFDRLSTSSFGYGGDANDVTVLRMSKDKWYDFHASFRRDRNDWDYNLLANPLNPPTSNPAVAVTQSPHRFQTVRRIGSYDLTLAPSSAVTVRLGFSKNVSEGPTFTTFHGPTETLIFQNWRNDLRTYQAGVDVKVLPRTTISYDQFIAHHKGDTTQNDQSFGFRLSNGAPVDLGIVFNSAANQPCAGAITNPASTPPTASPTCNAFLGYSRSAQIRALMPTEQLSFASDYFKRVQISGRFAYSGSESDANNFNEFVQDFKSSRERQYLLTGPAATREINVSTDLGLSWKINEWLRFNDTFRWIDNRIPGSFISTQSTLFAASLLLTPNTFNPATCPFTPATCPQHAAASGADLIVISNANFQGQDQKSNRVDLEFDASRNITFRLGYQYRHRLITQRVGLGTTSTFFPSLPNRGACAGVPLNPDGSCMVSISSPDGDITEINQHSLLFGFNAHYKDVFRTNFDMELMSADNVFTRISPRQLQHYKSRTNIKPADWVRLTVALNILENRNNVPTVNNLQHNRNYAFAAVLPGSDKWSVDLDYSYNDVFSSTNICFVSTPAPIGTNNCATAGFLQAISTYNSRTHFMATHFMWKPMPKLTTQVGYNADFVNGSTLILNPLAPLGPLQYNYHMPSADVAYQFQKNWTGRAGWNYYGYNEKEDPGFTAPRDFRGNVITLAMKYSF